MHLQCSVIVSSFCFLHFKRIVLHPVFVSADNQTRIKSRCRSLEPFRSHYYWFSVLTLLTGCYFSHTMYNNAQLWRALALMPFCKSQHNCRHFSGFSVKNILHWMNVLTWLQLTWLGVYIRQWDQWLCSDTQWRTLKQHLRCQDVRPTSFSGSKVSPYLHLLLDAQPFLTKLLLIELEWKTHIPVTSCSNQITNTR